MNFSSIVVSLTNFYFLFKTSRSHCWTNPILSMKSKLYRSNFLEKKKFLLSRLIQSVADWSLNIIIVLVNFKENRFPKTEGRTFYDRCCAVRQFIFTVEHRFDAQNVFLERTETNLKSNKKNEEKSRWNVDQE